MLQKVSMPIAARRVKSVVRSHLKTRQLALLVHLHEEQSLARAAAAAGLTQPAASKLLRQIERALEVKLFERHARGMEPTCYGEILVRHARQALCEIGLAREEIAALKSGFTGKAAVGAVLSPSTHLVPAAVARMKQRYPGILVSLEIDPSRQLVQRLLQGHLDIVLGRVLDSSRAHELLYEPLAADEPHCVVAGAQHPLAGRKDLQLQDFLELPWIVPPAGSLARDKLFALFMQRGLPLPANTVETLALPVITSLLRQSNMIAVLPEEAVQSCCPAGTLAVLLRNLPLGMGGFGLITRREPKLSPGARLMLQTLRELAGAMYSTDESATIRAATA